MKITFAIIQENGKNNFIVNADIHFFPTENDIREEIKSSFEEMFRDMFDIEYLTSGKMEDKGDVVTLKVKTTDAEKISKLHKFLIRMRSEENVDDMLESIFGERNKNTKKDPASKKNIDNVLPGLPKINWN